MPRDGGPGRGDGRLHEFASYSLRMSCMPSFVCVCVTARPCGAVYSSCVTVSPTLAHTEPQHLPVFVTLLLKSL